MNDVLDTWYVQRHSSDPGRADALLWDAIIAAWKRIGGDYATGWIISAATREPMRNGACCLVDDQFRLDAQKLLKDAVGYEPKPC